MLNTGIKGSASEIVTNEKTAVALFNCTCCTKDEAQRLCEDWLIKQDRCYIN